jgi:hypothetical protein
VAAAYAVAAAAGLPVNYGFAASWAMARMDVLAGVTFDGSIGPLFANLGNPRWGRAASRPEIDRVLGILESEIADGALGIGLLVGYAPGATPEEYLRVAALAAAGGVPTFTHSRDLIEFASDGAIDGAEEIVRAAGETGAHMHYCHVNSTTVRHADRVLALVERAQRAGARVSTEAYPYGAGMTGIGAAFLAPERLAARGLTPRSISYAPTGEEVASAARLTELRASDPGGLAIIRQLDDDDPNDQAVLLRYLTFPGSVIASDAMPLTWIGTAPEPAAWPLPAAALTHPSQRSGGPACPGLTAGLCAERDQAPSGSGPALRARIRWHRGPPSRRRPRAVRGVVVTVNPDAVRSRPTARGGQVR